MNEIPFIWDIVLVILAIPLLEVVILRQNYRIMSPVTIFSAAFFMLYTMPYLIHFYVAPDYHLSQLDYDQLLTGLNAIRCFLYTLCFLLIPFMFRIARCQPVVMFLDYAIVKRRMMFVFCFFCITLTFQLGMGVGFSPHAMIDRAFNPRAYTNIKAGLGPLTHLHAGVQLSLLTLAAVMIFLSAKSIGSILFFGLCAFASFLGGGKSSLVLPFIILTILWQKLSQHQKNLFGKLSGTILAGMAGFALVVLGFVFLGTPGETASFRDSLARIPSYHKEAYYLPLVIERFPWSPEYPLRLLQDTAIAPIPRAIWKNKPGYGIWMRYFRPAFEPNTKLYHTSTFGCLAEAHMFFGRFGPFIYGVFWAFFLYKLYLYMVSHDSLFKAFLVGTSIFWVYLLMRTGFSGTNFSIMIIYLSIGWYLLRGTAAESWDEEAEDDEDY